MLGPVISAGLSLSLGVAAATAPWYEPWIGSDALPPTGWGVILAASVASAVVLFFIPPLRRVAWWSGYLDHPEARKAHIKATPLLGGLAVAVGTGLGAAIAILQTGARVPTACAWWGAAASAALLLGLIDDRFGMHPALKLFFQFVVAALFLGGGVYPNAGLGPAAGVPLGLLWLVAMMNAVNFLDNMDGIVGGLTAILACGLGILLFAWGHHAEALFAFALAGAAVAFLRFNFSPASVFLGDTGSLFLGYCLGALSLLAAAAGPDVAGSLAGLLILGYPVFDLCFVVTTRLREGRKVYLGGQDHTTHRLNHLVRGPRRTALGIYVCAAALTASGVGVARAHGFTDALPWLAAWALGLLAFGLRLARVPVRQSAPC